MYLPTTAKPPWLADKVPMSFWRHLGICSCLATFGFCQPSSLPTADLENLSIEDLFHIQVTSVGRKAQQLSNTGAAVFVLTSEDIRRSGATSIPEALKWVPGLTVLQIDGRYWSISARGAGRLYADKILVMVDGRSLYTPLFAGVMWESIDVPLDLIEQIEVVLGPGAVMWGPNAVNGVINIITTHSRAAKGTTISASAGNIVHGSVLARWSAAPSDRVAYQIWGEFADRNPANGHSGINLFDSTYRFKSSPIDSLRSTAARAGFGVDLSLSAKDEVMLQGMVHNDERREFLAFPIVLPGLVDYAGGSTNDHGGFILGRWTHSNAHNAEDSLQFSFYREHAGFPFVQSSIKNLTVDYQRRRQVGEYNELYLGGGFQQYWDETNTQRFVGFQPSRATYRAGDAVLRDEFQLKPDRLLLTAGVRVDYTSFTRFEFQPAVRLLYTPSSRQSMWLGLSRAVRVPSRFDRDMNSDGGSFLIGPAMVKVDERGSTSTKSEVARTAEAGHRIQPGKRWSGETSVFLTFYDKLRILQAPLMPNITIVGQVPVFSIVLSQQSAGTGRSYGGETSLTWQVSPVWRLIPSYSYLNEKTWFPNDPTQFYAWLFLSASSRHQALLRSQFDLTRRLQVDLMGRARSRNLANELPGVLLLDARVGWRPKANMEFSISAQNLTGRSVIEAYSESPFVSLPLRRTFVAKWTQRF